MSILKKLINIFVASLLILVLATLLLGCRSKEAREEPDGGTLSEDLETVNLGGSIKAADIEIYLSPDIYESAPEISIKKVTGPLPDAPEDSSGVGEAYEINSRDSLNGSVLITIDYDPDMLPAGTSEENIYIATKSRDGWVPVEGGFVDIENNQVSVSVDHFSEFWTMIKETGDAIYDVVETLGIDTTTTGIAYSRLPQDIKDGLSEDSIRPGDVSAITKYKFSLIVKVGHSLNTYFNGLTKLSGLAIAAIDGTKKTIAEAIAEAVVYEVFEYTGNEKGTYSLIIYDTLDLGKDIGLLALDAASGVPMVALKGTNYLAARVMDDINKDMHDAFRDLISLNPNSTNRLELYSVCIDGQPDGNRPGAKGILFYYFDEGRQEWIKYYEDLIYWVVEFRPDPESIKNTGQETAGDYDEEVINDQNPEGDDDAGNQDPPEGSLDQADGQEGEYMQTDDSNEDITSSEDSIGGIEENPQGPVIAYLYSDGTGDYPDLEQAVKDVAPGSTIFLDSGIYYLSDAIYINKDIEIVGTRKDLVDIRYDGSGGRDDFIDFEGIGTFVLEDITFTAEGDGVYSILDLAHGNIQIGSCCFMGAFNGIEIDGDASVKMIDCELSYNRYGISAGGDSYLEIENSILTDNGTGISIYADGRITGCDCSWNSYAGISTGRYKNILIEDNIISNNGGDGIYFSSESAGIARYNECFGNESGIYVGTDGSPTLEYNICHDNELRGIIFTDNTSGIARQNECYNNNIGISIWLDASPQLIDNYCHDNYEKDMD